MTFLDRYGYSLNGVAILLWPLSLLFGLAARVRRLLYLHGLRQSEVVPVPLIVVGNISVGGTGKTPLVVRLVELLREAGYQPGVISRGYGWAVGAMAAAGHGGQRSTPGRRRAGVAGAALPLSGGGGTVRGGWWRGPCSIPMGAT